MTWAGERRKVLALSSGSRSTRSSHVPKCAPPRRHRREALLRTHLQRGARRPITWCGEIQSTRRADSSREQRSPRRLDLSMAVASSSCRSPPFSPASIDGVVMDRGFSGMPGQVLANIGPCCEGPHRGRSLRGSNADQVPSGQRRRPLVRLDGQVGPRSESAQPLRE